MPYNLVYAKINKQESMERKNKMLVQIESKYKLLLY